MLFTGLALLSSGGAFAETGVTPSEIRLGLTLPLSGPASSYSTIGKSAMAYVDKINKEGGIGGRKINVISYDDGYSPPKTVEMVRKLVESDDVLFLFSTFGTPTNMAILKYVNGRKIPHLFVGSGAAVFGDAKVNPWSMGLRPDYQSEGKIYARYIMQQHRNAKLGVIYQNDDYGRDYLKGLKEGLGENGAMIVAAMSYDVSSPSIDSQIVNLKASGADTLMIFASNKFAAQTIRKVAELGWKPTQFLAAAASSVSSVMNPAGFENAQGVMTTNYVKDPTDSRWKDDEGVKRWRAFMDQYFPSGNKDDLDAVQGYNAGQLLEIVLKRCGDNLSRSNIMHEAENLKDVHLDMLLPGITVDTTPSDHHPIRQMQLMEFKGDGWVAKGEVISGE